MLLASETFAQPTGEYSLYYGPSTSFGKRGESFHTHPHLSYWCRDITGLSATCIHGLRLGLGR